MKMIKLVLNLCEFNNNLNMFCYKNLIPEDRVRVAQEKQYPQYFNQFFFSEFRHD